MLGRARSGRADRAGLREPACARTTRARSWPSASAAGATAGSANWHRAPGSDARRSSSSPGRGVRVGRPRGARGATPALAAGSGRGKSAAGGQLTLPLGLPDAPELSELGDWEMRCRRLRLHRDDPWRASAGADAPRAARAWRPAPTSSHAPDGSSLEIAGIVVARQRPATARGVVFMLLEDELGCGQRRRPPACATRAAGWRSGPRRSPGCEGAWSAAKRVMNVVADRASRRWRPPTCRWPRCARSSRPVERGDGPRTRRRRESRARRWVAAAGALAAVAPSPHSFGSAAEMRMAKRSGASLARTLAARSCPSEAVRTLRTHVRETRQDRRPAWPARSTSWSTSPPSANTGSNRFRRTGVASWTASGPAGRRSQRPAAGAAARPTRARSTAAPASHGLRRALADAAPAASIVRRLPGRGSPEWRRTARRGRAGSSPRSSRRAGRRGRTCPRRPSRTAPRRCRSRRSRPRSEHHGHQEAHALLAGKEGAGEVAREDPQDDRADDVSDHFESFRWDEAWRSEYPRAGPGNAKSRPGGRLFDERPAATYSPRPVEGQVPSALRGLTALFGMGRGVSLSLLPPKHGETVPRRGLKTAPRPG